MGAAAITRARLPSPEAAKRFEEAQAASELADLTESIPKFEALLGQLQADSQRLLRRVSDSLQIFGIFFYFLCWILWFPCVLPTARCALCKCI